MLLWLSQIAFGQEFITDVGAPVEIRSAGAWIRVFPTEDKWVAALGSNQSFYAGTLQKTGDGLTDWELVDKRQIVELTGLIDHGIKRCPDGSYLHAASGMPPEATMDGPPIDYLHLWRYNEDFEILAYKEFRAGIGTHAHNDPNVICAPDAKGVLLSIQGFQFATDLFTIDENLEVQEIISLEDYPRGNGGSVLYDVRADEYVQLGMAHDAPLTVNRYTSEWELIESMEEDLVESPLRAYWPQGMIQVGDYYIVAHMVRDEAWLGSDKGDVFLGVFDESWSLVEQRRVTTYEDGEAAMRPWVARKGSQLLLSFDLYNEQQVVEAVLDLSAFGLDGTEPDTGVDPQGEWSAPNNEVDKNESKCGCSSSEALLWLPLLPVIGYRRRNPRD
jgi:hypothetical protein